MRFLIVHAELILLLTWITYWTDHARENRRRGQSTGQENTIPCCSELLRNINLSELQIQKDWLVTAREKNKTKPKPTVTPSFEVVLLSVLYTDE